MKTPRFFNEQINILKTRDTRIQIATAARPTRNNNRPGRQWDLICGGSKGDISEILRSLREENRRLRRQINELIHENRALTWIIEKRR